METGSARLRSVGAGVGAGVLRRRVGSVIRTPTVLWHVEPIVILVSLVSLFALDVELIEIEGGGRKRAYLCTKTVVPCRRA